MKGEIKVEEIPVGQIVEHPMFKIVSTDQRYEEEKIREIAKSIQAVGLKVPILVAKGKDKYILLDGHRRYMAMKMLAEKYPKRYGTIKAIVINSVDDYTVVVNQLAEKYTPSTLIRIIAHLQEKGNSITKIARIIGKSKSYVSMLAKLKDTPEVWNLLDEGIDVRVAYELAQIADKNLRKELMEKVKGKSRASALRIIHMTLNKATVQKDEFGEPETIFSEPNEGLTVKPERPPTPKTAQCFICGKVYNAKEMQTVYLCGRDAILLNELMKVLRERGYTLDEAIKKIKKWKPKRVVR